LLGVELDDQVLVDVGVQITPCGQALEDTFLLGSVHFQPFCLAALGCQVQRAIDAQLVLGLLANGNHITRGNQVGRNVHGLAVDTDGLVGNQLTSFGTRGAKTHTVYNVIQTTLEQLQQVLTGSALQTGSFLVVVAELTFEDAVDTTNFLLLAQLSAVLGETTATLTMHARRTLQLALGIKSAYAALEEQISAFATRQLTFGTNISSHLTVS